MSNNPKTRQHSGARQTKKPRGARHRRNRSASTLEGPAGGAPAGARQTGTPATPTRRPALPSALAPVQLVAVDGS